MVAQEKVEQKWRFIGMLLILGAVTLLIIPPVWADIAPPRTTVNVYFEKDNRPVNETVTFTMNCSACYPETCNHNVINSFGDVFSFSAVCPSYGCFAPLYEYRQYEDLTSCDFFGELKGERFAIMNVQNPVSCTVSKDWRTQSCELRVNLSSGNISAMKPQVTKTPTPPLNRMLIMKTPTTKPGGTEGIFADFICLLKNLFGGTC